MKKILVVFIGILLVFALTSCSKVKSGVENYQYMYDVVKDWNAKAEADSQRSDLFGFGEYLYNSHLILFPRKAPYSLKDFYFEWKPSIDVDGYAAYFTCKLNEDNFASFADGLENFTIKTPEKETKLLHDDKNFEYDAYIIQWVKPDEKWEVLEYVLLDEENNTVIFVYTMSMLDKIDDYASYNVMPKDKMSEDLVGFSIYDDFENATYDIEFLEFLNGF